MPEDWDKITYFKIKKQQFWLIWIIIFGSLMIFFTVFNLETGFWFDKPFLDDEYYVWHPHDNDTCDILQSKLDLFHPQGTNPVRFEILKSMFQNDCEVLIR